MINAHQPIQAQDSNIEEKEKKIKKNKKNITYSLQTRKTRPIKCDLSFLIFNKFGY